MIDLVDSNLYPAGFKNFSYIWLLFNTPAASAAADVLGKEYLFFEQKKEGLPVQELLQKHIVDWISQINFPKKSLLLYFNY